MAVADGATPASLLPTMIAGATAGSLSRLPCHPLDTIKSVQQAMPGASRSLLEAARGVVAAGGWRALYRGLSVAFVGSAPAGCLYLTAYEESKRVLAARGLSGAAGHLAAGTFAEAASCVFWVPVDVLKERMQVQGAMPRSTAGATWYTGAVDGAAQILRSEGLRGLYRGYGATLLSYAPYSAIYFAVYERLRAAGWRRAFGTTPLPPDAPPLPPGAPQLPLAWQVASSSGAGCVAALATNPLELAKLRLQVQRNATSAPHYTGTAHAIVTIAREEGLRALMRGSAARCAFVVPGTAITMTLFEEMRPRIAAALEAR